MTVRLEPVDVVVIGLGAAGGLAASRLALAGLRVVGLEAGPRHATSDFAHDEIAHFSRNALGAAKVNQEVPTVRSTGHETAAPATGTAGLMMINGVGGSKTYATNISWRMYPWNFRNRSATVQRYGATALPEGSTVADWPLDYAELAPFYDKVEALYGCSGTAGVIDGRRQPEGNPFEGSRSGPYPLPALRRSGYDDMMARAAASLGWSPFPTPASVRSREYRGMSGCTYCGMCTWTGCWTGAKGTPAVTGIPEAEASGNLEVRTGVRVLRIDTAGSRATGVTCRDADGRECVQPASVVLLAGYTYENTRLLLLSAHPNHPAGLGNSRGQVGAHFMTHSFAMTFGRFGDPLNLWSGTNAQGTAIGDFDADNFDHGGLGFIGGGPLMAGHELPKLLMARMLPPDVPRWGAAWKEWVAGAMGATAWSYTLPDTLPYRHNRLDLDPVHVDADGIPRVRITYAYGDNEWRQTRYLQERMAEWMTAAGAGRVWQQPITASPVSTHAYGGTRMGDDPDGSVTDRWGFTHDLPNLGVLGASCFPSAGGVNPTETVEALSWRTADRLLAQWHRYA
ncbi:GMC family oxidoreductase [Streptomyces sp. AgN23]|uniref:GMC family oxidoreductase n=1 Tax=Streptomyces sp. AgN23 TaxID=1188315 RepID=UPI001B327970|nr:GMC family oxidoreductase [Streptomyces sp. AgN23]QTI87270.1 GMC family oxidoreductase [Streptomyces sp. AgN23]